MKKLRLKRIITIVVFENLLAKQFFKVRNVWYNAWETDGSYGHEAVIMPFAEFLKTELDTTATHALFKWNSHGQYFHESSWDD